VKRRLTAPTYSLLAGEQRIVEDRDATRGHPFDFARPLPRQQTRLRGLRARLNFPAAGPGA
jgi:hypothetical protein